MNNGSLLSLLTLVLVVTTTILFTVRQDGGSIAAYRLAYSAFAFAYAAYAIFVALS